MADWTKRLQAAAAAIDTAREARDAKIREAYAAGMTQPAIAEALGMSRMQISRIINPK